MATITAKKNYNAEKNKTSREPLNWPCAKTTKKMVKY